MSLFSMTTVGEIKNKIDLFNVGGLHAADLTLFMYKYVFTKLALNNQSASERLNNLRSIGVKVRWVEYLDPTPKETDRLAWCLEAVINADHGQVHRVVIASKCNAVHFHGLSSPEDEVFKGLNAESSLAKADLETTE